MGFLGVYRAVYDYVPREQIELAIDQGDLLYVLEKNDDDGWWRAKKKAGTDDEDEPTGLVPKNYVEKVPPSSNARALYEYTRQTDEELSFPEDSILDVFDTSDPDWILAGLDGDYGFVPSNYIELQVITGADNSSLATPPVLPTRPQSHVPNAGPEDPTLSRTSTTPATALAGVMQARISSKPATPPPHPTRHSLEQDTIQASDDESIQSPALPHRSRSPARLTADNLHDTKSAREISSESHRTPGGFHMYNINEMVSVMGKRKKMPTTLGINLGTGILLIAPEHVNDEPLEWTADKMTHYSREGKHVFMELVRPSRSIDFHAGAKDTAEEIVTALGEMAGAARAEGLREVIMAGSQKSQLKGLVLYDFMAQGEDEVTVGTGDEVIIIDDSKSDEWWQVRRMKNGKEGVVPSSYVEVTGTITPPPPHVVPSPTKLTFDSAKSTVEQNRLEEVRLTKQAIRASKEPQQVGPGMLLPQRGSSLMVGEHGNNYVQRSQNENGRNDSSGPSKAKAKPDASKVRTWTDRSKSFSVDAQFLGLKDGKIHLHKMNGVKIAVPIAKMCREDLEYVEKITGISLDDERPLADVKRAKLAEQKPAVTGATLERHKKTEYDWFQFFLSCDVAVGLCERYAQAFTKDSMDESVLSDVDANILRTLGLREGDIIKVMRILDAKFSRDRSVKVRESDSASGGLFSGPRGTLRNNTRKGRPAPAVQTSDVVDASAFSNKDAPDIVEGIATSPTLTKPIPSSETSIRKFDDDAWEVKPSKQEKELKQHATHEREQATTAEQVSRRVPSPSQPILTSAIQELSLLSEPLQPTRAEPVSQTQLGAATANYGPEQTALSPHSQQLADANSSFFSTVPQSQHMMLGGTPTSATIPGNHTSPKSLARHRPALPSVSPPVQGSLVLPPPQRSLSAPQSIAQQGLYSPPVNIAQMPGAIQGQVAMPGQSLNEIGQARLQQQYSSQMQQLQPVLTGYSGLQHQGIAPYHIGGSTGQYSQPMMTGTPGIGAFVDTSRPNQFSSIHPQSTGFPTAFSHTQASFGHLPQGTINNYLPPPLEPQRTGLQAVQPQPLLPQPTGPPPPVRFGVTADTKKLIPQPTSRRANLSQATPQNPFGF